MKKRLCLDCEYYYIPTGYSGRCRYYPPIYSGQSGTSMLPHTAEDSYCSKWEPKWDDNEMIAQAWEDFLLVHKLITGGKNDT